MRRFHAAYPLLAGVSALALAATAAAQTAATQATAPSADAAPTSEVVVTGSRVLRNGNASPTPVTVVPTDQLLAVQPGPVAEAIMNLPVFAGSRNGVGNPGSGVTNAAAEELNLRYLGYARTLVLFDNHRIAPTTYDQVVDVDMIPQMLLQRVDVVTGGVSAVYGSDAVAGVVNYVTDTKFNGFKLDAEGGISQLGDDSTSSVGIAVGQRFLNDKLHVELSYEYRNDPGILNRSDRQWGADVWTMEGTGAAAAPYHLVENSRFANYTFGGLISGATGTGAALNAHSFDQNGVLSPFVAGASTGNPTYQSGGDGAYYDGSLKTALNTNKVFGRVDYDFTDSIHGYVEGSDAVNHNLTYGQFNQITNDTFNGQNAFLPPNYQFTGTFKMSEFLRDMPRVDTNSQQNQYFVIAGLDGKFGDYAWNIAYSRSATNSTTTDNNNVNNQKLSAALDAVVNPAGGQIVCRASLTNTAYSNCVPLNLFGPTAASAAGLAYITQATQFTVNNGLDDISGAISGSPFKDWAGPVTIALSGEWRNETLSVGSTALPTDLANCAGLTTNCTQGTTALWADSTLAIRHPVSESVGEGAVEVGVPLLKDMPFAQDVSFNGAARYTDYSVSGSAWTWKAGLVWQVNDEWKLRATRSRDIRAPTLWDLYQPAASSSTPHADTLTNTTPAVPTFTSGNPNLTPEVSNTTTAGFVYSPKWLPRFTLSMDAYYIDVSNAIVSQSGYNLTDQQICYSSGGSSPFCSLMSRPGPVSNTAASNAVTAWYTEEINANDVKTYGADFEANYAATVFEHPLTLRSLLTWQPHFLTISPGVPTYEGAGQAFSTVVGGAFALPVLRLSVFADYKLDKLDFGVLERWRSAVNLEQVPSIPGTPVFYSGQTSVEATAYTDLNIDYRLDDAFGGTPDLFINIQNLFNSQPPPAAGPSQGANLGTFGGFVLGDDPIGRYFTLGFRFRH